MRVSPLAPGARIRIKQTFRDFDDTEHAAGQELTLASHDVFVYDGGHTLKFTDGTVIRLAYTDPLSVPILDDAADVYWELVAPRTPDAT